MYDRLVTGGQQTTNTGSPRRQDAEHPGQSTLTPTSRPVAVDARQADVELRDRLRALVAALVDRTETKLLLEEYLAAFERAVEREGLSLSESSWSQRSH